MENLAAILEYVSVEAIEEFDASGMQRWIRVSLMARKTGTVPREPVLVGPRDPARGLVRVRYEFAGARPSERFTVAGREVEPVHAKDRALVHFDTVSYTERIVWLPEGRDLAVTLDGAERDHQGSVVHVEAAPEAGGGIGREGEREGHAA
ncbi:hypothetical protein [Demequina litorisediminis]|uniref:hypothetical protein n=1 Tax=Demequina litorisediminis TaxID=1849022 RepID=UPI0024E14C99|nr:hypothetical protein [Demequina litorisediminis]